MTRFGRLASFFWGVRVVTIFSTSGSFDISRVGALIPNRSARSLICSADSSAEK
jgi:hypothetical protein